MVIILGLGVAIYFIVDDAIDKKIESCMFKHFQAKGLLEKYNVTVDPSKNNFSTEDCASIIEQGQKKTAANIELMAVHNCLKQRFRSEHLDALMLRAVLEKFGRNGDNIKNSVFVAAQSYCASLAPPPNQS